MKDSDAFSWLVHNGLVEKALPFESLMKRVIFETLAPIDEEILIIGDVGFEKSSIAAIMSAAYYLGAKALNLNPKLVLQSTKTRGDFADDEVVDALKELPNKSIIIINASDRVGNLKDIGKSLRMFMKLNKHRFVSSTSLGYVPNEYIDVIMKSFNIDYEYTKIRFAKIKQILDNANKIQVTTPAGTNLTMDITNRIAIASDGNYKFPGTGGNLPAGEVFIPPIEDKTNGTLIIDGSSRNRHKTEIIREPIVVEIKNGKAINITGGVEADLLEQSFKWAESKAKFPENVRVLAEFAIGLNPFAKIIGSTIIDEKSQYTGHIAFGSNKWFGGNNTSVIHLDQVFKYPKIIFDDKECLI